MNIHVLEAYASLRHSMIVVPVEIESKVMKLWIINSLCCIVPSQDWYYLSYKTMFLDCNRPANLWSSKTVFFNPKSCILLTKVVFLKINMDCYADQCLLQFLHTGRIFLWIIGWICIISSRLVCSMNQWASNWRCEMLYRTEWAFFIFIFWKSYFIGEIVLSYLLLKIVLNTTKSNWLAGLLQSTDLLFPFGNYISELHILRFSWSQLPWNGLGRYLKYLTFTRGTSKFLIIQFLKNRRVLGAKFFSAYITSIGVSKHIKIVKNCYPSNFQNLPKLCITFKYYTYHQHLIA